MDEALETWIITKWWLEQVCELENHGLSNFQNHRFDFFKKFSSAESAQLWFESLCCVAALWPNSRGTVVRQPEIQVCTAQLNHRMVFWPAGRPISPGRKWLEPEITNEYLLGYPWKNRKCCNIIFQQVTHAQHIWYRRSPMPGKFWIGTSKVAGLPKDFEQSVN